MSQAVPVRDWLPLQPLSGTARWSVLLVASALAGAGLQAIGLPAALMLGPLGAAVLVQAAGGVVRVPRSLLAGAQAVIGCLVARSMTPTVVSGFLHQWPIVMTAVGLSLGGAVGIGWAMGRLRIVPGTTAVWGMLPGAATAMMVMAEAYGADSRLVAFMQYLRVVMVAAVASILALIFAHGGVSRFAAGYFPPVDLANFAFTLAIAAAGAALGYVSRIPAGVLFSPLILGAIVNGLGWVKIELPPVVLIASYALIGWNTGLRFTRDVLAAAARALPQCLGATALLMTFCGGLSWMLAKLLHVDALTAYLATSPGGVDAAAVIAASTKVDVSFVMMVQSVRVVIILALGPTVARMVAATLKPRRPTVAPPEPLDLGDLD